MAYPDDFIPELWSPILLDTLDKSLVLGGLANRDYEGEIRQVGDIVRIQKASNLTVNTYAGTVTYETPASTTTSLTINQDKYIAFEVDDLDAVQSNVDLIAAYTDRGAYGLADDVDAYIASLYTAQAAGDVAWTVASDNAYEKIVDAGRNLDDANVPRMDRWLAVGPQGHAALLKNANFIHATVSGDQVLRTGVIGSIAGFTVVMSNNLVSPTTNQRKYMYGHRTAITMAMQLLGQMEAVRRDASFDTGIRARIAYGAAAVQASALGTLTATEV